MPAWANANTTPRHTALSRGAVAALALLVGLLAVVPAAARIDNSKNRDNPTNVANPWTEDLAREVGIVEKINRAFAAYFRDVVKLSGAVKLVADGDNYENYRMDILVHFRVDSPQRRLDPPACRTGGTRRCSARRSPTLRPLSTPWSSSCSGCSCSGS